LVRPQNGERVEVLEATFLQDVRAVKSLVREAGA
jgi:hypothetical protein